VPIEMPIAGYSSGAQASAGQSYTSIDGSSWTDLEIEYPNSNVCIKAYTTTALSIPSSKIAVYSLGDWFIDNNGDGQFDPATGDQYCTFGSSGWIQVIGDWNGDGFTEIGVYQDGSWLLDYDGSWGWSAEDKDYLFGASGWIPIIGDWNGDGLTEIGVYQDGSWLLDYDGSGGWSAGDRNCAFGAPGWTQVIGDWNGDGIAEIGVYQSGAWLLDYDGSGGWSAGDKNIGFGDVGWTPVIGDWNGDGCTKIGVYKDGAWFLDYDGSGGWNGEDKNIGFGDAGWTPVIGDWNGDGYTEIGIYQSGAWLLDYDGSGGWSAGDRNYGFGSAGDIPFVGKWRQYINPPAAAFSADSSSPPEEFSGILIPAESSKTGVSSFVEVNTTPTPTVVETVNLSGEVNGAGNEPVLSTILLENAAAIQVNTTGNVTLPAGNVTGDDQNKIPDG